VFVWEESSDWPLGTNAFMVDVCAQHASLGLVTILKGPSNSTTDLQSLPWIGCPPPVFAPLAFQPPAFPPVNWQTRVPSLALNLQQRQTFDLTAERLTNVSAYVLSGTSNSAATVANMSAAGLFAICYVRCVGSGWLGEAGAEHRRCKYAMHSFLHCLLLDSPADNPLLLLQCIEMHLLPT
jgi:hypothetical protein